jgi:hypothetical protein
MITWLWHGIHFFTPPAIALAVLLIGLWLQGWLAGRQYGDRARSDSWGRMWGALDVRLIRSKRREDRSVMILHTTDLRFERPNGEIIGPPTIGRFSDGQSIPPFAWVLVGSPLTGRSRDIAIGIHDEECAVRRRPAVEAHGIMYEAMRSRGMYFRGPIMHAVLLNWGSKW